MKFSGPDLIVSMFQVDAITVSTNVFTEADLRRAATRLLHAWPLLSFRTDTIRSRATEKAARSIDDGFLNTRIYSTHVLPDLSGTVTSHGIAVHDGDSLNRIFSDGKRSWLNTLCPRIFAIHAVIFQDATVFKFTMQHAAGDAVALHNAAAAFCKGLHDEIPQRDMDTNRQYRIVGHASTATRHGPLRSSLRSQQACEWWDSCTANKIFPVMTLARKWQNALCHETKWRTIHVPGRVFDRWRTLAFQSDAKVSDFDLFASWIQLNLADFAHSLDPRVPERLAFTISMRKSLESSKKSDNEIGNPFSIAMVSPFSKSRSSKRSKLVSGAINVRSTINMIREPTYAQDYAELMANAPYRQGQIRKMGKRVPVSMLLTSWSHTPFGDLEAWSNPKHSRATTALQPVIGCIPSVPVPGRCSLDPQIGVIWKGKEGDGYWFTAKLEEELWRGILDVSL